MRLRFVYFISLLVFSSLLLKGQTYKIFSFTGGGTPDHISGTSASFGTVMGVATDAAGNVYIPLYDYDTVVRLDSSGTLTRIAGNGTGGFSGDGGSALNAQLNQPTGVAVDQSGNIYIVDRGNDRIRKVSNGIIQTVAGGGNQGCASGAPALQAEIGFPMHASLDPRNGDLYFAGGNFNCVMKLSNGTITNVAGNGIHGYSGDNGPALQAQLNYPMGVAVDATGTIYIADSMNNVIRKVAGGIITTAAGDGTAGSRGDGGPAFLARLSGPVGIAVDGNGVVYFSEQGNGTVRKLANGFVNLVASLSNPFDVSATSGGVLYVPGPGTGSYQVFRVLNGALTSIAGGGLSVGDGGPSSAGQLYYPQDIAVDGSGRLYIADELNNRVRQVAGGLIATVAGPAGQTASPSGVAVDAQGILYIADQHSIRRVAGGALTTLTAANATNVAVDAGGTVYWSDRSHNMVWKLVNGAPSAVAGIGFVGFSGDNGLATNAALAAPEGLAFDAAGNLYIADTLNGRIRKVSNGIITTVAGNGDTLYGGENVPVLSVSLYYPIDVAFDGFGNMYIAEPGRIRKVTNGTIFTIAGIAGRYGYTGDGGLATEAQLTQELHIAVDSLTNIYISDAINNRIRILVPPGGIIPGVGAGQSCQYSLSVAGQSFASAGGAGMIQVSTQPDCFWTPNNLPSWITTTSLPIGVGSGTLTYSVAPNGGADRSAAFTLGGQTFSVEQTSATLQGASLLGSIAQIVSAGTWASTITALNLGDTTAQIRLSFSGDSGNPILLPLTAPQSPANGTFLASTLDRFLAPRAQLIAKSTGPDDSPTQQGWSQLLGSGQIGAFAIFSNPTFHWEAVVPLESRNAAKYILAFDNSVGLATGVAIANLSILNANISAIVRDDTGSQIATTTIPLNAFGHTSFMLPDRLSATANRRGTVEFDAPPGGQISVLGLRANGAALTTLPVMANVDLTGGSISHVTFNGGFTTLFTLVNTGTSPAQATLAYYDNAGNPLSVPMSLPQTSGSTTGVNVTQTIAPGASLLIQTQAQDALPAVSGSAVLTTNGNVSGFGIFNWATFGQEASVPLETRNASAYVLAFDNTGGLTTGLALANVSAQAASVGVVLRDDSGAQLATGIIALPARGHTSFMLPDNYSITNGKRGTIEFDTPLAGRISAVGLRAKSDGTLTTIPVFSK